MGSIRADSGALWGCTVARRASFQALRVWTPYGDPFNLRMFADASKLLIPVSIFSGSWGRVGSQPRSYDIRD
jgi:hypothetical protein